TSSMRMRTPPTSTVVGFCCFVGEVWSNPRTAAISARSRSNCRARSQVQPMWSQELAWVGVRSVECRAAQRYGRDRVAPTIGLVGKRYGPRKRRDFEAEIAGFRAAGPCIFGQPRETER